MRILLDEVLAQDVAVKTLRRALAEGRVHHAYLFDGPDGVGKELTAFGLAQALVCEKRGIGDAAVDRACGDCGACRRAVPRTDRKTTVHPDVVVVERALYEPAQIGRRTPETQEISIDQVRTLVLARAAFPPHEGRAKVFVIRRAEELSTSAANALLKTLEEPGARTHFILLTAQPETLLPTIRSRTQRLRFAPLPESVVSKLLADRGVEGGVEIARLSGGSMAAALGLADPDETEKREAFVTRAMRALETGDAGATLELAEEAKKAGKDPLIRLIIAFGGAIAARAADLARNGDAALMVDTWAARYPLTLAAIEQLEGNASAQLVVEAMLLRMRAA